MKLRYISLLILAIYSVIILSILFFINDSKQKISKISAEVDDIAYNYRKELYKYETKWSSILPTRKPFVYLTETAQCLPPNLASPSQIGDPETCNCDVIVLSYRATCQENNRSHVSYLFDPNTRFASGRNVLYFAALNRTPGYYYYIFLDDDTALEYNNFTTAYMRDQSPFRAVEKWLLDYEPVVGVLNYTPHNGAEVVAKRRKDLCGIKEKSPVLPTVFFDAIFNAFHNKAIEHILPYPTQYESMWVFSSNRYIMIVAEVKFGGQALLFAPVTAVNLLHRESNRSRINITEISHEFIENIRQQAPPRLRNHVLFEQLHKSRSVHVYLTKESQSFCVNVTRHQPIIPYRHLLSD